MFYADLSPVVGSKQGGIRPVLILQNDIGNRYSPTVIVAAITARDTKASLPTHVLLSDVGVLKDPSTILLEQLRTIDRRRLREYIGHISGWHINRVNRALEISVGIAKKKIRIYYGRNS